MTKKVSEMKPDEIKEAVRDAYSRVAELGEECGTAPSTTSSCCETQTQSSCCDPQPEVKVTRLNLAEALGYDTEGMPTGATESFAGCGNPVALANIRKGDIVLDLGSGAGFDAFIAAKKVGNSGKVLVLILLVR